MASYTANQLSGAGTPCETLNSGTKYTFTLSNSLSGSAYFTFETIRNSEGYYDSSSPVSFNNWSNFNNINGFVSSSYIFSVVVNSPTSSFNFSPLSILNENFSTLYNSTLDEIKQSYTANGIPQAIWETGAPEGALFPGSPAIAPVSESASGTLALTISGSIDQNSAKVRGTGGISLQISEV